MNIRSLGYAIMIFSVLITFIMFMFSDWDTRDTFIGNLRYSSLLEPTCQNDKYGGKHSCEYFPVSLGQGLIFPLFLFATGLICYRGGDKSKHN